jgi:hypothetical protein
LCTATTAINPFDNTISAIAKVLRAFDEAARLPFDEDEALPNKDGAASRASSDKKGA